MRFATLDLFKKFYAEKLFKWSEAELIYGSVAIPAIRLSIPKWDYNSKEYKIVYKYWVTEENIANAFKLSRNRVINAVSRLSIKKAQLFEFTHPEKINVNRRISKEEILYFPEVEIFEILKDLASRKPINTSLNKAHNKVIKKSSVIRLRANAKTA